MHTPLSDPNAGSKVDPRDIVDGTATEKEALAYLQAAAAPAVLRVLRSIRIPMPTESRLRDWLGRIMSGDRAAAIELVELDQAYQDLSILYLSAYSYALPTGATPNADRIETTDRGGALTVSLAQACIARIASMRHGEAGVRAVLAAIERERGRRREICERVASLYR